MVNSLRWLAAWLMVCSLARPLIAAEAADVAAAARSITVDELRRHVDVLADDTFEGREAGSRGGRAAGNYLIKAFEQYGLKPAGEDGSYVQTFNGQSRNILGLLEGSDPKLAHEVVLFGAHYDHVGYGKPTNSYGPFGYIHNGADDNASGISGLLEVVDAMKRLPTPPKRSILFAFWDGEEQGLLGSKHWAAQPTIPLDRIVLAINVDMIGRLTNDKLEIYGTRTAENLRQLVSRANREPALTLDFTWKMKAESDHYSFYERGIPVLMFHTGLHKDYHRPSDDAHLINVEGMQRVVQLCFQTLELLADSPQRTTFRTACQQENVVTQAKLEQPTPPPPPRIGFAWRKNETDGQLYVNYIVPGTPAVKAGFRIGDKLLTFRGEPISDEDKFYLQLLATDGPTQFEILRSGEAEPRKIELAPAYGPIRVGLSWRVDDSEPRAILLTQVVHGSPAARAGLQPRDRIYAVNDQPFQNKAELQKLLDVPGPLNVLVERQGKLQTLEIRRLEEATAVP